MKKQLELSEIENMDITIITENNSIIDFIEYNEINSIENNFLQFSSYNKHLRYAVNLWIEDVQLAMDIYGPISTWEVNEITDMSKLFLNASNFNEDISEWNTERVTNMDSMFENCKSFNIDLRKWKNNVKNVVSMNKMFFNCP